MCERSPRNSRKPQSLATPFFFCASACIEGRGFFSKTFSLSVCVTMLAEWPQLPPPSDSFGFERGSSLVPSSYWRPSIHSRPLHVYGRRIKWPVGQTCFLLLRRRRRHLLPSISRFIFIYGFTILEIFGFQEIIKMWSCRRKMRC